MYIFGPMFNELKLKIPEMFHMHKKTNISQILSRNVFTSLLVSISPLQIYSIHLTGVAYQQADLTA